MTEKLYKVVHVRCVLNDEPRIVTQPYIRPPKWLRDGWNAVILKRAYPIAKAKRKAAMHLLARIHTGDKTVAIAEPFKDCAKLSHGGRSQRVE